jgi:hypothetical protein
MDPSSLDEGGALGAEEIADALVTHGQCVIRMHPLPHQRLIDVHWAAHRAGELLDMKVSVVVRGPVRGIDPMVVVTVRPRMHQHVRAVLSSGP